MKQIFLIRHAKSDHGVPGLRDFDRPLNDRGRRDAPVMAGRFAAYYRGDAVYVTSPAKRALSTASAFMDELHVPTSALRIESAIYEASLPELLQVISGLPESSDTAVLFGHNPGLSMLSEYLSNEWIDMPTCAIVHLTSEVKEWQAMGRGTASLRNVDYPKRTNAE